MTVTLVDLTGIEPVSNLLDNKTMFTSLVLINLYCSFDLLPDQYRAHRLRCTLHHFILRLKNLVLYFLFQGRTPVYLCS